MSNCDICVEPMPCPCPGFGIFETNWGKPAPMPQKLHDSESAPVITPCH